MFRKSPDTSISLSLYRPLYNRGEAGIWGGGGSNTWKFERLMKRAPGTRHISARDSVKGTLREGSFTGEPKDM